MDENALVRAITALNLSHEEATFIFPFANIFDGECIAMLLLSMPTNRPCSSYSIVDARSLFGGLNVPYNRKVSRFGLQDIFDLLI